MSFDSEIVDAGYEKSQWLQPYWHQSEASAFMMSQLLELPDEGLVNRVIIDTRSIAY